MSNEKHPDPLSALLARALAKAPELVPGMNERPYRRGDYAAAQRRRERRGRVGAG